MAGSLTTGAEATKLSPKNRLPMSVKQENETMTMVSYRRVLYLQEQRAKAEDSSTRLGSSILIEAKHTSTRSRGVLLNETCAGIRPRGTKTPPGEKLCLES